MTEEVVDHHEKMQHFIQQFEAAAQGTFDPDIVRTKRAKAWDHFLELGIPHQKDEDFMYISLDSLLRSTHVPGAPEEISREVLREHILPEALGSCLVFVNGAFRRELSSTSALHDIVVLPLTLASRTYSSLLNSFWSKSVKEETDPFAALNAACHQEGLFIYIPPGKEVIPHIQILYVYDAEEQCWTMPKLHLVAGKSSKVTLLETYLFLRSSTDSFVNGVVDLQIEENAQVNHAVAYVEEETTSYVNRQSPILMSAFRAFLKRDSQLTSSSVLAAHLVRRSIKVQLLGSGAQAELTGVSMLADQNQTHTHVLVDHQDVACQSTQLFKSVLNDSAKSSFQGKILVRQRAQKTQAYQLNNNLLLSPSSEANSKPNLEIFADDVKASHGATSGRLDEEQLFYLRTRGLQHKVARACLIQGFCEEVVQKVPNSALKAKMHSLILALYSGEDNAG